MGRSGSLGNSLVRARGDTRGESSGSPGQRLAHWSGDGVKGGDRGIDGIRPCGEVSRAGLVSLCLRRVFTVIAGLLLCNSRSPNLT
jgi:hypothetical protein